jgi:DNA-binding response OmpR family regulator
MPEIVILLVEGKRTNGNSVEAALKKADYNVQLVHTGKNALTTIRSQSPQIIIFNASTMRSNGARSCNRLRRTVNHTPIIHIRAQGELEDISANADVYLEQPFTPRKLLNRIKSFLPPDYTKEEVIRCGNIIFCRTKRSIEVIGKGESRLTPKLAQLLEEFARHPHEIVSRRQLMQNVWKTDYIGDTRTLDVHIRWIRELIESDPAHPCLLRTVRGKGYVFFPASR